MSRKSNILFLLTLLVCTNVLSQQESGKQIPPDILFITVDDLNDWVGFLGGHPQAKTPNLDRLASMGMVFTKAYTAAPVCNPSRVALLSGVSPAKSGIYGNSDHFNESSYLKNVQTLPKYFSRHGYFTTGRGKLFHQMAGDLAQAEQWDKWIMPEGNGMGDHPDRKNGVLANGMPYETQFQYGFDWGVVNVDIEETRDYITSKWAAEELLKKRDRPVFIACGLFRPHLPWYVAQKYFDQFPLEEIVLPEINENDLEDLPLLAKENSGGLDPDKDYQRIKNYGLEKKAVQAYLAAISYADDCLGVLLEAIEGNPKKDNTIVMLMGDHGWHLGEKLHYRKFTMWEEACRVPLIVIAPGIAKASSYSDQPVNLLDLYPSLVEIARLPHNDQNDGRSILPLLKQPDLTWPYGSVTVDSPGRSTVRTQQWRYIKYEDGSEELYDHDIDPLEWNNLAQDIKYQGVIEELSEMLPRHFVPTVSGSTDTRGDQQDKIVN